MTMNFKAWAVKRFSISSVSSRPGWSRSETPSSILSSDSDIRFTRKLGDHYRCGCCLLAAFLVLVLVGTLALYAGYTYLSLEPGGELVFRGLFRVSEGDRYSAPLADPSTDQFKRAARDYREGLNLIFRRSPYRPSFLKSEVLAFDGDDASDLMVHFNLHFDPRRQDVTSEGLMEVLGSQSQHSPYLANRTLDPRTIKVWESLPSGPAQSPAAPLAPSTLDVTTPVPPPPRRCQPAELDYCRAAYPDSANASTSYPNLVGHASIQHVLDDIIAFRELVDAECSRLAYQFVCLALQPPCDPSRPTKLVRPCRDFCQEFWSGCGSRLPVRLRDRLDCSTLPEYSTVAERCVPKPGCRESLELRDLSARVCDGVPDCADLSDELQCRYCRPGHLQCPNAGVCTPPAARCDGRPDCPDGSDEKGCLALSPSVGGLPALRSAHPGHTLRAGQVVFTEKGERGKLCVDDSDTANGSSVLRNVATSLCRTLLFQSVEEFHIETDMEEDVENYVEMEDPSAEQISFIQAPCANRTVLHVTCQDPECGVQPMRGAGRGLDGLGKMAALGDWPWHAALLKDGVHVCDATVVHPQWLLTSASCFQGQQRAEWVARPGSVRLTASTPWQQQRHITGMTKSPVEGSTMVLVKLDAPLLMSDFVRPICLPRRASPTHTSCHTLGWTRNREVLQRVELRESRLDQCANVSIMSVNALCADSVYSMDDCMEEELAGSPMMCVDSEDGRWTLVGVSNWRIACAASGNQRPRMYDKLQPNTDWVLTSIREDQATTIS